MNCEQTLINVRSHESFNILEFYLTPAGRKDAILHLAKTMKPKWKEPLTDLLQLTDLSLSAKKQLISDYIRLLHWSPNGKDFQQVDWSKIHSEDFKNWPSNANLIGGIRNLNAVQLTEVIRNLDNIELQPSFFEKVAPRGKKRKSVD